MFATGTGRFCWKPSWIGHVSVEPVTGRQTGSVSVPRKAVENWTLTACIRCRQKTFSFTRSVRISGRSFAPPDTGDTGLLNIYVSR